MDDTEFAGHLIHQAVHWNNSELLQDLLSGDQRHLIDSTDSHGRTALHVAVEMENMVCTKILLDNGADGDAVGPSLGIQDETRLSQIETALHISVRKRNYSLTSLILQSGTNPNIPIIIVGSDDCEKLSSTALKEACRNRDASLVDLLVRYGARDDDCQALLIASENNDFHLMSKLLAIKSFADPEFKISKKAVELPGLYPSVGGAAGTSVTFSSMFPTTPVMINWHSLQGCLKNIRKTWLIDAALAHNIKLKLNIQNQSVCLMAVTRLDLSNNGLKKLPLCIFQMPSLRILTLSQNKLESLPETETSDLASTSGNRMKKSISYSSSLTSGRCAMLWILPCLEELHLQDNRLESVPVCVFDLPSLQLLDLSNNKLRCLPPRVWSASKLRDLNLSMNLLRDLPSIKVSPVAKSADDSGIMSSPRLPSSSSLDSESNSLTSKRSSLTQSSSTKQFDSDGHDTGLENVIPREITHVNLFGTQVSLASSTFHEEEKVRSQACPLSLLNLSHNGFTSIPPVLSCVATNLTRLNMSYNCLTCIGSVKLYPTNLKHLDLSFNQLNSWSKVDLTDDELTTCGKIVSNDSCSSPGSISSPIRAAVKSSNKAYCIHRLHVRLDNLRSLVLANNQLQSLNLLTEDSEQEDEPGSSRMRQRILFPNLSMLDVSNNIIKEVPVMISELSNLSVLHLNGNTLVSKLPPEMGLLSRMWNLSLRGCNLNEPLKSMVESKKYKTMDIIGYLKSVLEDSKPYARMKLMVVGLQGIGKTSLLEQLRQEGYGSYRKKPPEHWAKRMGNKNVNLKTPKGVTLSTVGVDVCDWTFEKKVKGAPSFGPVSFRTWDFGGQKEYYSTHQYFLSKRSLYLVVWKMVDGEKAVEGIQQWLVNIQARAPNAPVIIVGTHYDLVKEFFPPFYAQELQQTIRDKFINVVDADKCGLPRVVDSVEVSAKTKHNIKLLCNLIYDTVFGIRSPGSKERLLEQKIPATYLALEEVVSLLANQRISSGQDPVLRAAEYKELVSQEMKRFKVSFRDSSELQQATSFLHDNGVLLHYEDSTLKDLYFLDPQWLCDILAHVVTVREINPYARNGIMSTDDLKHLFKGSSCAPSDTKTYIINLLNKFEVALTWDSRTLLVPSLLPTEKLMVSGLVGEEVRIPVRSRGWGIRGKQVVGQTNENSQPTLKADTPEPTTVSAEERPFKSIFRLLLMTYFPSGFWSRLMTRLLGDDFIIEIIRWFYTIPKDIARDLTGQEENKAEWVCWQTGLALKYFGDIIFRIKEVIPSVSNKPVDYKDSNARFTVNHEGNWTDISLSNSSILEIYIPNHALKIDRKNYGPTSIIPNQEYVTKLLSLTVDHIDTLLEDWYPSLGTRFVHTSEGKFLVTRLVPCISCITRFSADQQAVQSPTTTTFEFNFLSPQGEKKELVVCEERRMGSRGSNYGSDVGYESASSSRLPSRDKSEVCSEKKGSSQVVCFLVEECILQASEEKRIKCPVHGDVSLKVVAPDTVFVDLGDQYLIQPDNVRRGKMLGRGAFGFVFKATIKSKGTDLSTSEAAMKMLQPVDPGHGAKKSDNVAYKVAHTKWQRDPMQYACKAYCTARQELTILLSLRHPHIVPLIGVCTRPLALILQLAPHGALDVIIREYRRSGAKIDPLVTQKILLQVSRALEYLHQQHIIYRDLKSENVLVWKMYRPHETIKSEFIDVEVKVADYGISRSTLPTGTKGFGGTEGFMAPEIMRFNGEEEYTEKVDCFSFGMFIYELVALRLPFEGQESVKDHILDGGRPPLTPRDTLYPSNILDLMVLCWAEHPQERPSASQIVSMVSTPEFVHQLDTVRLKSSKSILNSCVLTSRNHSRSSSNQEKTWETWLSRLGKQTDVLVSNKFNWTDYKTLKSLNNFTITSIVVAEEEVWCGDSNATIHVFDNDSTYEETARFKLDPRNETPTAVKAMEFSFEIDAVLILTTNGRLWLCSRVTHSLVEVDTDPSSVLSFGIIDGAFPGFCEVWTGIYEGNMGVVRIDGLTHDIVLKESLCHYSCDDKTPVMDRMDVFNVLGSSKFVWTYLYPGCLIFQWDIKQRTIIHRLDISKLAPCSESIMSISIEEHLSPTNCQVTSMAFLQEELFVGTTWGCLIVIESEYLRPITVFRPHEEEIKAILSFEDSSPVRRRSSTNEEQVESMDESRDPDLPALKSLPTTTQRFLVTVGRGSRSLVSRYIQAKTEVNNKDLYAILWKTGNWQT